jgi:subtilisin family serine protease
VAEIRAVQQQRREAALARAAQLGLPTRITDRKGRIREIYDLDEQGRPLYRTTFNLNAARTSGANLLQAGSPPLTGSGVIVGVWDGGLVRGTHQELTGRVTAKETGVAFEDHATHVAGTIAASGVVASAKGMAPAATLFSYDWNNDYAEMTAAGATAAGQTTKLYLSNHSYGTVNGWDYQGSGTPMWIWNGTGTGTTGADAGFGQYGADAADIDAVVYSTPYLLPFVAAGNDGTDNPANGESIQLSTTSTATTTYNSTLHPGGDGTYRGGYDNIASISIGKNVLTVGATTDAVTGTVRDVAAASVVDFSSWGPTDDGRIKPDLVANGDNLNSSVAFNPTTNAASTTSYDSYSGTSMATPSVAGSAALLVQLYGQLFPNGALRASTLKAVLIHTADDLGTAGPDYRNGWGLVNVKAAADLLREHAANPAKLRVSESRVSTTTTTVTYDFTWDGVSPIRATLCWTDPAGTSTTSLDSRTSRLVNNLDLAITGPDGTTYQPYVMPFVGVWTQASMAQAATRGLNSTDNVEQVYLAAPPTAGVYRAVVSFRGTLTSGQQDFGLIITGSTAEPPPPTAPTITTHPQSQSGAVGGSVTFSVDATGTTPFTYQWRKGGQAISGATNATLTLANLQTSDAGSYDVVVTNSVGSATSNSATLTVSAITTITWNFTSNGAPSSALPAGVTGGTVTQGNNNGTTSFPDGAAPSSGYTGASGGGNLGLAARTGALNTGTNGSAFATFTLTPDAGRRLVISAISFAARRSNTGPQAWALYSSADNYATALATGTIPSATTWVLFAPTISTITTALGTPVTFRIYGYNGSGSAATNTANFRLDDFAVSLAVQTPPSVTTPPATQTVVAGSSVTFSVTATGTDPLSYQWRRNTQAITGATAASYTISSAQTTDSGSFDVIVSNPAGSVTSAAATLTVTVPTGFNAWVLSNFDATERANPAISGPDAVLGGDGLTNFLKYALGLDPRVPATAGLPAPSMNATHWLFTYTRPVARDDVTYTVEASPDLVDWTSITVTATKVDTTNGIETWRAEVPLTGRPQLFFRLKVAAVAP